VKDGMLVKWVGFVGHRSDRIEGYLARSLLAEPTPGVGALHHAPGLDPWCRELVRNFVSEGSTAIAPHWYHRHGPDHWVDVAAAARADGLAVSRPNEQVMGDIEGAASYLRAQPGSNGKVGVIGFCSGRVRPDSALSVTRATAR
jgi:carboxymethylenebutenolidase